MWNFRFFFGGGRDFKIYIISNDLIQFRHTVCQRSLDPFHIKYCMSKKSKSAREVGERERDRER